MDYAICLDQFSTNFDVNNLSSNGFSIYTNLDNYTTPIAQNIPYQDLFSPPIGNCPLVVSLPQGATQLVVIDACTTLPTNIASIFTNGSSTANNLITQCCYATISVPTQSVPWCDTADLSFDIFSASFVGQIIAGNLNSSIGSVTDYKIGWYKDGDYSAPEFTSGYGNAFTPYQLTHPLAGNTAPYVTAGDWEGIIHDIAINGITYSSVSGSAGGQPIPFESCFGTIVVAPLTCNNGTFPLPYTHQKEFTAAGNGATPPVIGATYQLSDSTEYFAYSFRGFSIWDELEIKFISGDPNNTSNPSLYSQPIYLEKARIGSTNNPSNINTLGDINNNTYPKQIQTDQVFKRVLTLTNISRSANPSLPDVLDIKITPNPTNNQTSWTLQMQCLDTFDCTDCLDPFPRLKIDTILLDKLCCGIQQVKWKISGSCNGSQELWNYKVLNYNPTSTSFGYTNGYSGINSKFPPTGYLETIDNSGFSQTTPGNCNITEIGSNTLICSVPTPNSIINYHKSITTVNGQPQGIISMSFNNQTDYLYYKNQLTGIESALISNPEVGPITYDPTDIKYYTWYFLNIPQTNIPCGDGVPYTQYIFHRTAYPNIVYVENPSNNYWSITIPMPVIQNQYPQTSCSNCWNLLNGTLASYNNSSIVTSNLDVTNNFGSISNNAFSARYFIQYASSSINNKADGVTYERDMPIYSFKTLPFVSSSNGWVNLPSLEAVPCPTLVSSSMPYIAEYGGINAGGTGTFYRGVEISFSYYFPNLTGSSDWFQIYTNVTSSTGYELNPPYLNPPPYPGNLIYEYTASVGTVYSSSYFVGVPTVTINNLC
jgi:hypothetical protein